MGLFGAAKGFIFGSTSSEDAKTHEERAAGVSQDLEAVKQAHRSGDDLHAIFSTVVRLLALTLTVLPYIQVRSDLFAFKGDLCLELAVAKAMMKDDDDRKAIEGWIEEGGQAYESWNKTTPCQAASKLHAATRTIGARVLQHTASAWTYVSNDPSKTIDEADAALRCLTGCSVLQQELIVLNNKAKATAYTALAAQSAHANDEQHYHAAAIEAIKRCVRVGHAIGTDGRLIHFFTGHMPQDSPTTHHHLDLPTDITTEILSLSPTLQALLFTHTPLYTFTGNNMLSPAASPVRGRGGGGGGGSGGAAAGLLEAAGGGGAIEELQSVREGDGVRAGGGGTDGDDDANVAPAPVAAPPAAAQADGHHHHNPNIIHHTDSNNNIDPNHHSSSSSSSHHRIPMDLAKPAITTAHKNPRCWWWGCLRIGNLFSACMDSKCEDDGDDGTDANTHSSSNFSSPRSTSTPTPTPTHNGLRGASTSTTSAKGNASQREFSLLDTMGAIQIVGEARGLFVKGGSHNAAQALKLVDQAIAVLDKSHTHSQLIHPAARLRSAILDAMDHQHQLQEPQQQL